MLGTAEEGASSPEEGARDLSLVQALLKSGSHGGSPVEVVTI